jgi:hypothetical protein
MLVIPLKAIGTGLSEIFGAKITAPVTPDAGPDAIGFVVGHAWFWSCFGLISSFFLIFWGFTARSLLWVSEETLNF